MNISYLQPHFCSPNSQFLANPQPQFFLITTSLVSYIPLADKQFPDISLSFFPSVISRTMSISRSVSFFKSSHHIICTIDLILLCIVSRTTLSNGRKPIVCVLNDAMIIIAFVPLVQVTVTSILDGV